MIQNNDKNSSLWQCILPYPKEILTDEINSKNSIHIYDIFNMGMNIFSADEKLMTYLPKFASSLEKLNLKSTLSLNTQKIEEIQYENGIIICCISPVAHENDLSLELMKNLSIEYNKKITALKSNHSINISIIEKEGYMLKMCGEGLFSIATTAHGIFNSLQTLLQILKTIYLNDSVIKLSETIIFDYPDLEIRAFHLDLKDLMPTLGYTKELIEMLAHYKHNCIFIEYEDKFPYSGYLAPVVHKDAWSLQDFNEIMDLCKTLFIEVIPLIQVFGHVEFIIEKPEFEHIQETKDGKPINLIDTYEVYSLCPLEDDSKKVAFELVDQIIAAHPECEYVHIGADEVYQLGLCPKCKDYLKNHTKSELYIQFINLVAQRVLELGKKPIMWHDYLLKYPDNLDQLNKDIVVMYWIYKTWRNDNLSDEEKKAGKILPHFEFFHDKCFKTMGAPSISSDFDLLIPNLRSRLENIAGQSIRIKESGSLGSLSTSWVVCANPLDTQIFGIAIEGELMWAVPEDWKANSFPWSHYDRAIFTQMLGIPLKNHFEYLKDLCIASEREKKIYPSIEAIEFISKAISKTKSLIDIECENSRVLKSVLVGLNLVELLANLVKDYRFLLSILKPYSETDKDSENFPSMDKLLEISKRLENAQEKYEYILSNAENYYISETSQIIPGQWAIVYGMDRFHFPQWVKSIQQKLEKICSGIDGLLLEIFRQEMELNL